MNIKSFIEFLKEGKSKDAIESISSELYERSREITEAVGKDIAKSFKLFKEEKEDKGNDPDKDAPDTEASKNKGEGDPTNIKDDDADTKPDEEKLKKAEEEEAKE